MYNNVIIDLGVQNPHGMKYMFVDSITQVFTTLGGKMACMKINVHTAQQKQRYEVHTKRV